MPPAADTPAASSDLAVLVRAALAERYAAPVVRELGDGTVAVPAGKALEHVREVLAARGEDAAAERVVELDVAALPWHAVPDAGLCLWRQHGRAGAEGELVTEVVAGDPPLQLLAAHEGWSLARLADGATGWLEPDVELAAAEAPPAGWQDAGRVEAEALAAAAERFLDVPYVWGGTTDDGIDCSGLVQRAAWQAGRAWLPRHSRALLQVGARVKPSAPRRGDVLVLRRIAATVDAERRAQLAARAAEQERTGRVGASGPAVHPMHVAVALSDEEALHASRDAMRVVREPIAALRERYRVLGVRRVGAEGAGS